MRNVVFEFLDSRVTSLENRYTQHAFLVPENAIYLWTDRCGRKYVLKTKTKILYLKVVMTEEEKGLKIYRLRSQLQSTLS